MVALSRVYRYNITLVLSAIAMMLSVAQLHLVDKQAFSVSTNLSQR